MALTKLTSSVNIIQTLPDTPNAGVGGLTATQLKQKFDESANIIKTYVNNTLTTELDTSLSAKAPILNPSFLGTVTLPTTNVNSSLYVANDDNLFGKTSTGGHINIGTVQQNDILQYGDINATIMWLLANNYISLRSPNSPSYQKIDGSGNTVGAGRTIFHQGNSCNHAVVFSTGTDYLTKNSYNTLFNLPTTTDINGQFPVNSFDANTGLYTIPRAGMYDFDISLKIDTAPPKKGYVRFALYILKQDGTSVTSDMEDQFYDPTAYGTPFISGQFMYRLSAGDKVAVKIKPLTDDLTVSNGTKLYLYGLGDTIQE
jgi:hypothetical protein